MIEQKTLQPDRSKDQVHPTNYYAAVSNPVLPKAIGDIRSIEIIDSHFDAFFGELETQNRAFWLEKFEHYDSLPKGKKASYKERVIVDSFITKIAGELLQNPQDINFMQDALAGEESTAQINDPKQQFVQIVKDKCLTLIKDNWKDVSPGQLANIVRIYANDNDPSHDFAKGLLTDYFRGPKGGNRNQRIGTYYNLVSGVLNLAEDDAVFIEGMKIALHATRILPKVPSLLEQTELLNFPFDIKKEDFQKLLIARRIVARVCSMDLRNLGKYYQERADYMNLEGTIIEAGYARKDSAIRHKGVVKVGEMYRTMKDAIRIIATSSKEPLPEVRNYYVVDSLKPVELAFDPKDPLNQKFEAYCEYRSRSDASV